METPDQSHIGPPRLVGEVMFEHVIADKCIKMVICMGANKISVPISVLKYANGSIHIVQHKFAKNATVNQMSEFVDDILNGNDNDMCWSHPNTKITIAGNILIIRSMMTEIILTLTTQIREAFATFIRTHITFLRMTGVWRIPRVSPRTDTLAENIEKKD